MFILCVCEWVKKERWTFSWKTWVLRADQYFPFLEQLFFSCIILQHMHKGENFMLLSCVEYFERKAEHFFGAFMYSTLGNLWFILQTLFPHLSLLFLLWCSIIFLQTEIIIIIFTAPKCERERKINFSNFLIRSNFLISKE
jgi:hypothetical protein